MAAGQNGRTRYPTSRGEEGITDEVLDWDYAALLREDRAVYDVVKQGGMIHVFNR